MEHPKNRNEWLKCYHDIYSKKHELKLELAEKNGLNLYDEYSEGLVETAVNAYLIA